MADVRLLNTAGPSRITRSVPEIIDVDSLPDDEVILRPQRRHRPYSAQPSQSTSRASPSRGTSVIYILDSDEEDAQAARRSHGVHRSRLFSPPPPAVIRRIPPVPPIPQRFVHHRSRAQSGQPPPVIVPNADPFPFEAQLPPHRQPRPVIPPRGAPRSHHQPAMGLGGALIALNRQNAIEEENRRRNAAHQAAHRRQRFYPFSAFADALRDYFGTNNNPPANAHFQGYGDWVGPAWDNPWGGEWLPEGSRNPDAHGIPKEAAKPPAWIPSYTHLGEPGPGFSYDFDPKAAVTDAPTVIVLDDDEAVGSSTSVSSAAEMTLSLVCARCLDSLALSSHEDLSLSPEEVRRRRVWALRCGHMLDGKCVDELMRPEPTPVDEKRETTPKGYDVHEPGTSKGKARAPVVAMADDEVMVWGKKRKAVDPATSDLSSNEQVDVRSSPGMPESASMRSRLRPRPQRPSVSTPVVVVPTPENPIAAAPRVMRPMPRRSSNIVVAAPSSTGPARPKGKGRARKPVVQERHEWFCPVTGCCREHFSVLMRGEDDWKMEENVGAIALFV